TVVVLERNPKVQEVGAGLQISPNARRVLNQLGLDKAISTRSFEPQAIDVYPYRAKRPVVSLELGGVMRRRYGVPYAVMHRADLADARYRACKRVANIALLFHAPSFDAVNHARGSSLVLDQPARPCRRARRFVPAGPGGLRREPST